MTCKYVTASEFRHFFNISKSTLYQWKRQKKIDFIVTPANSIRYKLVVPNQSTDSDVSKETWINELDQTVIHSSSSNNQVCNRTIQRYGAIYIRVSSTKQRDDLERQKNFMSNKYPNFRIYKDIGSGINFKRPQLLNMLEHVKNGSIETIVISSKDRLCRIAFDLFVWFFKQYNCELVVLEQNDLSKAEEWESELLSIVQIFCCRWNGKRRYIEK
jgi:predicted site-specific integrase-resolvase